MSDHKEWKHHDGNGGGFVYFMAFLGALVYFLQTTTSFWDGLMGILQAVIWPAILVYKALELLNL
jgi:hypothetical protein